MAGQRWLTAVEAKTLLWASPPDAGQYLSQQGGVHLGQEQQPGATPRRRHKQKAQFASAYSRSPSRMIAQFALMGCTVNILLHCGYEIMGYIERKMGAFMRVNLLLLNEEMWEAGSKWKTPQSKFVTVKTWGNTRKIENLERKT
uniref:Uncharacterized protein n=1 Tax=Oryza glumipatula TaxID=40148 RepID=A0A0D9ZH47_9ORYZ